MKKSILDLMFDDFETLGPFQNKEIRKIDSSYLDFKFNEDKSQYEIQILLPGFKKKEIKLKVVNNDLIIKADSKRLEHLKIPRSVKKQFTLSDDMDKKGVSAILEDGILSINIKTKKESEFNIDIK